MVIHLEDTSVRLQGLRALTLFNANPDERIDRLTRAVKRVFDVPVAEVRLVVPEMMHTISGARVSQTPTLRELSSCSHAIHSNEIMNAARRRRQDVFQQARIVRPNYGTPCQSAALICFRPDAIFIPLYVG